MIKDNEERTRAYIRALTDIIEDHQAKIQSIGGTYIANYELDDDDSYSIYCPTCNDYIYDERDLVDIPDINTQCHKCAMTEMEKDEEYKKKVRNLTGRMARMQEELDKLNAENVKITL